MKKLSILFLFLSVITIPLISNAYLNEDLKQHDPYTLKASKHLIHGYTAMNQDGTINVLVEIPAGSNDKWEVDKKEGSLKWEFKEGKPRVVKYLPYPANYGMIPQTLLSKESGGDGDPLDVIVLGEAIKRGTLAKVKIIGVLNLVDRGEQDDKIIAVAEKSMFGAVTSIQNLKEKFPGVTLLLQTWFTSYKGPGKLTSSGYLEKQKAEKILNAAMKGYQKLQKK